MLLSKIKELLGSLRFWIVTLTAITAILEQLSSGELTSGFLFKTFEIWLGVIVTLGTFDSIATKFGAAFSLMVKR